MPNKTACFSGPVFLWLCVFVLISFEHSKALAAEMTAKELLLRVKSRIDANTSSAKSISMQGTISLVGKASGTTSGPEFQVTNRGELQATNRVNVNKTGKFIYIADDFGRHKKWQKSWNPSPDEIDKRVFTGTMVLDASTSNLPPDVREKGQELGAIYPANQFLPLRADNIDFYRDHWFDEDVEPLEKVIEITGSNSERFKTRVSADGNISVFLARTNEELLRVNSVGGFLPTYSRNPGGGKENRWAWSQDTKTGIWYPKEFSRYLKYKTPSGGTYEETISIHVDKIAVNEPVDEAIFTFEGLGLKHGSRVFDMRVSPPKRYEFNPTSASVDSIAAGLSPLPDFPGHPSIVSQMRSTSKATKIFFAANVVLFLGLGVMISYFRYRNKAAA